MSRPIYIIGIIESLASKAFSDLGFLPYLKLEPPPGALISYATVLKSQRVKEAIMPLFKRIKDKGGIAMLDSGAFSAYSRGLKISITDYISFIREVKDCLTCAVCLDVIGDAEATAFNYKIMLDSGIADEVYILPVYHAGSSISNLKELAVDVDWIGVGGVARLQTRYRLNLFRQIAVAVPDKSLHFFGVSDPKLISAYWPYSFDSSQWSLLAAMGQVWMSTNRRVSLTRHLKTYLADGLVEQVEEFASEYGLTLKMLVDSREARHLFNYMESLKLFELIKRKTAIKRQSVF